MIFRHSDCAEKLKHIKVLLLDVDGVLTDGSIIYNDDGLELKAFNVKDGLGIRLLLDSGIQVGIVTGRRSNALHHRCKNLGITCIFDGVADKKAVLDCILKQTGVRSEEIAFMGDDLPDIPLLRNIGLSIAVADAHPAVIEYVDTLTDCKGGAGAVREVCEAILNAKGLWGKILEMYQ